MHYNYLINFDDNQYVRTFIFEEGKITKETKLNRFNKKIKIIIGGVVLSSMCMSSLAYSKGQFRDVLPSSWSYQAIKTLAEGGLVSGVGDNRFSPDRGMKISEFCQVLANAINLESGADETGYWAAKAIKSCIDRGYIYSHGTINSKNYDEIITREEAIAAMQLASGREKVQGKNVTINDIPDGSQIDTKYKKLIVQAYNSGITTGVNEQLKFSPKNQLTRAQVCQLFYNVNWTTKKEATEKDENITHPKQADATVIAQKLAKEYPEYSGRAKRATIQDVLDILAEINKKAYNGTITITETMDSIYRELSQVMANAVNQYSNDTTTVDEMYRELKSMERMNKASIPNDISNAKQVGKAIRIWLTDSNINELKVKEEIIKGKFVKLSDINNSLNEYIYTGYKPTSLSDSYYYVILEDLGGTQKIKIVVAKSLEEANSLKNSNNQFDGINAGWIYSE